MSTCPSADGHLNCFYPLPLGTLDTCVQFSEVTPRDRVQLLGLREEARQVSKVAALVHVTSTRLPVLPHS